MRVPMDISKRDNVYNAMFEMLTGVSNFNETSKFRINKVLCPGLGTATGRMELKEASRQMFLAIKNFQNPTTNINWKHLQNRNQGN